MSYKIEVDKKKCIGCGACVAICPKSFRIENEKSTPINPEIDKIGDEPMAESACPAQAIKISKI